MNGPQILLGPSALAALVVKAEQTGDFGLRMRVALALPSALEWDGSMARAFADGLTPAAAGWLWYEFSTILARNQSLARTLMPSQAVEHAISANAYRWNYYRERAAKA